MATNAYHAVDKRLARPQPVWILLLLVLGPFIVAGCAASLVSPPRPEPYSSFYNRVANRVSALTEWHLQGEVDVQERLDSLLPHLAQSHSVVDMRRRLRHERATHPLLDDMTDFLEQELLRPRNEVVRERRNDPRIAREMVAALIEGMENALTRLRQEQSTDDPG